MSERRKVRVMVGPRGARGIAGAAMLDALTRHWDTPAVDLTYQVSKSVDDGKRKVRGAIEEGVETILVVGGDGIVSSIGSELIGSPVALGVIPAGSGNGFARHFDIPLDASGAAAALVDAERHTIDVGTANGRPFLVTCSMAWDATVVRTFEKFPVRGILPYVLAAATELITYEPKPIRVILDGDEKITFKDPLIFTVANLTQYGGGAQIAPHACPDDGALELVTILRQDAPQVFGNMNKLFDGTLDSLPGVASKRFRTLDVHRARPGPIQLDGELVEAPADIEVRVMPKALTVLVPRRVSGKAGTS